MGSPLPPDPYVALGCVKDEPAASIKQKYRKLVLKYHPDKVQDVSQKQAAADNFHKIQTAYEIIGDEARRARYDAQCKLAELRKEMMERTGGERRTSSDDRSTPYAAYPERSRSDYYSGDRPARATPQYEERKPSYAPQTDYFEAAPRSSSRKNEEYERSSKRTSPRDDRTRSKSSRDPKESERSTRKEKSRKTQSEVRRDRDRKYERPKVQEVSSDDDSDEYERVRKPFREEDATPLRRAREDYFDMERRQKEAASTQDYYTDERAQKMFSQTDAVHEYLLRTRGTSRRTESEIRRPEPKRTMSSRENVESVKTSDGMHAYTIRRGSGDRPRTTTRDSERRSRDPEIVEEPREELRRPPTLSQSKSSPADIRSPLDRGRSFSMQAETLKHDPMPQMRRRETMPHAPSAAKPESRRKDSTNAPTKSSRLQNIYPTPASSPEASPRRFEYGREYADDAEVPTPDGYRAANSYHAEVREPVQFSRPRYTRSPSPIKDASGGKDRSERQRSASSKFASSASAAAQPPPPPMSRSTSHYVYPGNGHGVEPYTSATTTGKPAVSRENSGRGVSGSGTLYGEIPTSRSPRQSTSRPSPPLESQSYFRDARQEEVRYPESTTLKTGRPTVKRSGEKSVLGRHTVRV